MKIKFIILSLVFLFPFTIIGQTNSEISNVYIKRSEVLFHNLEMDRSLEIFNKALKYMDSVPNSRVAKLGALLYFEHEKFFEARSYAKWYFELEEDKETEDYQNMLETYVNIQEEIDKYIAEQKALELKRLREDKEAHRLDSLNKLWTDMSKAYTLKIDSIYKFNKHSLAVFSKDGQLGIMDDVGNVIDKPQNYNHFITYDGYVLMLDKQKNPEKIYAYNCNTKQGFLLPSVSTFNVKSTHYGKVMLPRGNGLMVTYPNNSKKAYVYNVKDKSFMETTDLNDFLKMLKKNDIIEKYKDEQVRINKQWLTLGNHLGAGVYELYGDDNRFGFLNTSDGKVLDANFYNYLGGFYNGNFELLEDGKQFWMDADGIKRETNKDENGMYSGTSRFVKHADGTYGILQNREGKDYLVFGDKALLNKVQFIEESPR
tara:strand:- start:29039 stop:30322 length:1284 start_codon:yes stop_codon:yes gene_type:complete